MKGCSRRNIGVDGEELPLWQRRDLPWIHPILGLFMIALLWSWADNAVGQRVSLNYFFVPQALNDHFGHLEGDESKAAVWQAAVSKRMPPPKTSV